MALDSVKEKEKLLNDLILYLSLTAILLAITFLSQMWALVDLKNNPLLDNKKKKRWGYILLLGLPGVVLYIVKYKK